MTFSIDTGNTAPAYIPQGNAIDDGMSLKFIDWTRADRTKRKIMEAIENIESLPDLEGYYEAEDAVIDALHLFDETMSAEIVALYQERRAALKYGAKPYSAERQNAHPAQPGSTSTQRKTAMFKIDANTGGESGPFLNYKQRAGQGMPDGSWYLRQKEGDDWKYTDMTDRMKGGIVLDIFATHDGQLGGTLKLGYIKFNDNAAADRHWWRSPLASEPRPDESKNASGGYVWQNIVTVRAAIGGGESALFDVSGWGGYKGVMALIEKMNSGFGENLTKCPVVQYTNFRVEGKGTTRLHVPEFVIAGWVDRPDCLKSDAPAIATGAAEPAPQAQSAPQPAPQPAASSVPASASF